MEECSKRCPLCNARLLSRVNDTVAPHYRRVAIIPAALRPEIEALSADALPAQDSLDNDALLCYDHALDYEARPSVDKCRDLLSRKNEMRQRLKLRDSIDSLDLEDELSELLDSLDKLACEGGNAAITMNPVEATKKIRDEYALLRRTIEVQVTDYYQLLRSAIDQMTASKSLSFRKLSSSMRSCYVAIEESGCDQNETFGMMADWVADKTGCRSKIACQVLVSFFVQDCEVFDAPSE